VYEHDDVEARNKAARDWIERQPDKIRLDSDKKKMAEGEKLYAAMVFKNGKWLLKGGHTGSMPDRLHGYETFVKENEFHEFCLVVLYTFDDNDDLRFLREADGGAYLPLFDHFVQMFESYALHRFQVKPNEFGKLAGDATVFRGLLSMLIEMVSRGEGAEKQRLFEHLYALSKIDVSRKFHLVHEVGQQVVFLPPGSIAAVSVYDEAGHLLIKTLSTVADDNAISVKKDGLEVGVTLVAGAAGEYRFDAGVGRVEVRGADDINETNARTAEALGELGFTELAASAYRRNHVVELGPGAVVPVAELPQYVQVRDLATGVCHQGALQAGSGLIGFRTDSEQVQFVLPLVTGVDGKQHRVVFCEIARRAEGSTSLVGAARYRIERHEDESHNGRGFECTWAAPGHEAFAGADDDDVAAMFYYNNKPLLAARTGRWGYTVVETIDERGTVVKMYARAAGNLTPPLYERLLKQLDAGKRQNCTRGLPNNPPEFKFKDTHGGVYGRYKYGPDPCLTLFIVPLSETHPPAKKRTGVWPAPSTSDVAPAAKKKQTNLLSFFAPIPKNN
jgi:hypothetical protein